MLKDFTRYYPLPMICLLIGLMVGSTGFLAAIIMQGSLSGTAGLVRQYSGMLAAFLGFLSIWPWLRVALNRERRFDAVAAAGLTAAAFTAHLGALGSIGGAVLPQLYWSWLFYGLAVGLVMLTLLAVKYAFMEFPSKFD